MTQRVEDPAGAPAPVTTDLGPRGRGLDPEELAALHHLHLTYLAALDVADEQLRARRA